MGVYIKGMEMPERCWDCYFCYDCSYCMAVDVQFSDREDFEPSERRLSDCPLVPIPPHGRLVDADRLLSEQMKRKYYHLPNGDTAIPIIDIEHAPTIIPAEEVYGQYTDTAGNFHWCGTHSGEHKIKTEEGEA